jgi:phage terminase large subunit-like protein
VDPLTGRPEAVGQVLLSATKKDQAEVIYSECVRQRAASEYLKSISECKNKNIIYTHNQSFIRPMGSDKPFDGMNPSCVINDELHAWREFHRKFWDTMVTGSGYRTQPLQIILTTAGDDQSHLWKEQYDYAAGVARGEIDDPTVFGYVFELDADDDPFDEKNWPKANPNLGVSLDIEYLRQQVVEAKYNPSKRNQFTRYHCNRIVSSSEQAIDLAQWDKCAGELSDWRTADAIAAGVDLGGRDDLAAYGLCARWLVGGTEEKPIWRYEIKCKSYIADECNRNLDQQPWQSWCYAGHLIKCRYPIAQLRDDLLESCSNYGILEVGYDPWGGQQLSDELDSQGLTPVKTPQNFASFSEPIKEFLRAIVDGRLRHDGENPLLRWCAGNAVIRQDRDGEKWMFDKRDSNEKIDPLVATVMAFRLCSLALSRASGSLFVI